MSDRFGIPENMFGPVPEDFYALVGRIALVATLVEDRLLAILWALDDEVQPTHAGLSGTRLRELIGARLERVGPDMRAALGPLLTRVQAAMDRRNAVIHSLWPNPSLEGSQGWRSRRLPKSMGGGSEIVWTATSEAMLIGDLAELVSLSTDLLRAANSAGADRRRSQ
jgi:hypothetical protein